MKLLWVYMALPVVISASFQLATKRPLLASLCGAMILPVMVLVGLVVWPPPPLTEWPLTLALAIIWGSITGPFCTAVIWAVQKWKEDDRKPRR